MTTTIGTEDDPVTMLQHVLALDRAAIEGYRIASQHVDDPDQRAQLEAFEQDHQAHVRELEAIIGQMGGTPASPDEKPRIEPGMVLIRDHADQGLESLFRAMLKNEEGTYAVYERAASSAPAEAQTFLARGQEDERRHVEWIRAVMNEIAAPAHHARQTGEGRPGASP